MSALAPAATREDPGNHPEAVPRRAAAIETTGLQMEVDGRDQARSSETRLEEIMNFTWQDPFKRGPHRETRAAPRTAAAQDQTQTATDVRRKRLLAELADVRAALARTSPPPAGLTLEALRSSERRLLSELSKLGRDERATASSPAHAKMLLALDGSADPRKVTADVVYLATSLHCGSIEVLDIMEDSRSPGTSVQAPSADLEQRFKAAREYVSGQVTTLKSHHFDVTGMYDVGRAGKIIRNRLRSGDFAYLYMANRRDSGVARVEMTCGRERVIRGATMPVLEVAVDPSRKWR